MIITLPFPDARLSPNARVHYHAKARVTKAAREAAKVLAWATHGVRDLRAAYAGTQPILVTVTVYPPDKRDRDQDNIIASLKASFDGLADALAVNDSRFRPQYHFADPAKPGRIEIRL